MNAAINVEVKNLGHKVGTVGWLTQNIEKVTFGETAGGKPAAWLKLKNGSSHLLAIFDPWDVGETDPKFRAVEPVVRSSRGYGAECDMTLTDAAWSVFKSIADQSTSMLNAILSESEELAPEVLLVAVK
mgnify:CR=1 FL=1